MEATPRVMALVAEGEGRHLETKGPVRLVCAEGGRFMRSCASGLPRSLGYDGARGWATDVLGLAHALELADLDIERVFFAVWSGTWRDPASGVRVLDTAPPVNDDDRDGERVTIGFDETPFLATLVLDPTTRRPLRLVRDGVEGRQEISFEAYERAGGDVLAHRLRFEVSTDGARIENDVMELRRITRRDVAVETFALPVSPPVAAASFDTNQAPVIPLRCARSGHLLIDVTIDGETMGPFIFDSGAGATGITPAAAERLGLAVVGEAPLASIFGLGRARVRRGSTLRVGQAVVHSPVFVEMDLAPLAEAFGEDVLGIVGFDVLQRTVAEIDVAGARITLHDPQTSLPGGQWQPLRFQSRTPVVPARFPGHEALFRLDAGAAGEPAGNVMFNVHATNAYGVERAEGEDDIELATMRLAPARIEWFELAGHRIDRPNVLVALEGSQVIANDPYLAGNVGLELFRPFRVLLDYAGGRVAFVPREPDGACGG